MQVRLIAGKFGGRRLDAPDNSRTHPMGERIRNAMFNIIGQEIKSAQVLDAFAGTGVVGLEALSRGAAYVNFVEKDRIACKILQKNINLVDSENRFTKTSCMPVNTWINTVETDKFDVILVDPPYHDQQFSTVAKLFGLLKPNGLMVLSHIGRSEVPVEDKIVVVDNRSYGNAHLTFYRRVE